jgi:hypothetical protein
VVAPPHRTIQARTMNSPPRTVWKYELRPYTTDTVPLLAPHALTVAMQDAFHVYRRRTL